MIKAQLSFQKELYKSSFTKTSIERETIWRNNIESGQNIILRSKGTRIFAYYNKTEIAKLIRKSEDQYNISILTQEVPVIILIACFFTNIQSF